MEQRLIVNYSPKYKAYERSIRERQIERAQKIVDKGASAKTRNQNSPTRFVMEHPVTKDGEIAEHISRTLDNEKIHEEEYYDGFSAVCTNLDDPASMIVSINKRRWEIKTAFRVMKSEFRARPVYVRNFERTALTDKLHDISSFRTDSEIITEKNMKKILKASKM